VSLTTVIVSIAPAGATIASANASITNIAKVFILVSTSKIILSISFCCGPFAAYKESISVLPGIKLGKRD
jgi:hypothetical protein